MPYIIEGPDVSEKVHKCKFDNISRFTPKDITDKASYTKFKANQLV